LSLRELAEQLGQAERFVVQRLARDYVKEDDRDDRKPS
jgi:hypothetical protein